MNSVLKLMARLTGEALSEKFDKVGRFAANVTKGLGIGVAILGLAGCPQPTNGGDIDPNDKPTTHTVNNAGYDLVIPKPEIGWSNTRAQNEVNEVNEVMVFLRKQCSDLLKVSTAANVGLVNNAGAALSYINDVAYNQPNIGGLEGYVNTALNMLSLMAFPDITSDQAFYKQFNAFRMGTRAEQRVYLKPSGGISIQKETAQNAFNDLITDIKQNYGVNNLPQSGDYTTTLAQLRANLNGFMLDATSAEKTFLNDLLQMVQDVEQFIGFVTDLGDLWKNVELQAQAHANSNVKIAFPEPQAQPKLTRAEIQAQHGIVNSEELLHGHAECQAKTLAYSCA
jgi:hypothetical protein